MMGSLRRLRLVMAALIIAVLLPPSLASAGGAPLAAIGRESLRINFGDFQSQAELTYPAGAAQRRPAVILIPGSGLENMDAAICAAGPGSPVLSHNFLDIANYLTPRGFAVLRYNKHYVTGPCRGDYRAFSTKLTLQHMLRDAARVLAVAEADPHVDAHRIYLYGWSEGSTIAAALAARHPELVGLIVQGPVARSWRGTFLYQITDVGIPYLRRFAPDGRVTAATLRQAYVGPGGLVARSVVTDLADPQALQKGRLAINPFIDRNHDGAIEIDTEFLPALPFALTSLLGPRGFLRIYGLGYALPTVTAQAPRLKLPVLILQGANDANVPPAGAREINAALNAGGASDHTLNIYPGLGHSLGPADSVIDDNFRPIALAPLVDLADWLGRHQ